MNLLVTGAWSDGKNCISELDPMGHNLPFIHSAKDPLPLDFQWLD